MNDLDERLIDFDLPCVACEYNLRTQPVTGRCPECQSPDTRNNGQHDKQPAVQYRKCLHCGHRYKEIGRPV